MADKKFPEASVVDGHNQAFYYWLKAKTAQKFGPAILAHFDAHDDMLSSARTVALAKRDNPKLKIRSAADYAYADKGLNVANFICAAAHHKIVGSAYWFDPRSDHVVAYGDCSGLRTRIEDNRIRWEEKRIPPHREMPVRAAIKEITTREEPIILDIDLDVYLASKASRDDLRVSGALIKKHATYVTNVVKKIPAERVVAVTLATSQKPIQYTPAERVPELLALTKKILAKNGDAQAAEVYSLSRTAQNGKRTASTHLDR
jgi:hypothetical protein